MGRLILCSYFEWTAPPTKNEHVLCSISGKSTVFRKINYASCKKLFKELNMAYRGFSRPSGFWVIDQNSQKVVFGSITQEPLGLPWFWCYFWFFWTIYYGMHIVFKGMLIILRWSTKHANFGAFWGSRCSTPLNTTMIKWTVHKITLYVFLKTDNFWRFTCYSFLFPISLLISISN